MTPQFLKPFKPTANPLGWLLGGFSIMDRYITLEFLAPFLFGVGAFSSIGVAIGALFDLVRKITDAGLPLTIALEILLLKMPEFIVYSFPMSVLMAALMTYSRLSSDSELVALRSCGISLYRLFAPIIVISCLVTGMTFLFHEVVVPQSNYQASQTLQRALKQERPTFNEKNIFYQEFQNIKNAQGATENILARIFYAREFDGQRMKGLTILDFSQQGLNQIVAAESATWNIQKHTWDFQNGTIYLIAADGSYRNILNFERQELQLPRAPLDLATQGRDFAEMNIAESQTYLKLLRQGNDEQKVRKLTVIIQQKLAFPFVCVVFGIVGAALGTRPQRTSRAMGFGISVFIIFGYYLVMFLCGALGQSGAISPFLAGWLPNILGLSLGLVLLARVANR
ncbi:MAG: LptF/LptG family permease [Leptolyngbyaceae cyanobacterium bins.59]|nr:LptF/LptG family permease [Leptolyngbyaceae cyanobacterium bins.59]